MTTEIERLPGERPRAYQALLDYVKMPRRSLAGLRAQYRGMHGGSEEGAAPTRRLTTLYKWSALYHWQERVIAWEYAQEQERLEKWQERKEQLAEMDWQDALRLRKLLTALAFGSKEISAREHASLASAMKIYDEMMRLAASEPTAHVNLTGTALRSLLGSMEAIVNGRSTDSGDAVDPNGSTDDGEDTLEGAD